MGDVTILAISGALVEETYLNLRDCVKDLVAKNRNAILLNLENVVTIDTCGVGCLIGFLTTLYYASGCVKLLRPSSCVRENVHIL